MNKEQFIEKCKEINIDITEEIYQKLYIYFEMLVEWNNKFNLTSILEENDVFLLHFYDSLCLIKAIDFNKELKLCDFGTGAGFPGMLLALLFKNINVTLVESNNKKCTFLNEVSKKLNLDNVKIICDRVENYARKNREIFDVVTCRAVTSIPVIIELSTALVKINGYLVPLKSNCKDEIKEYDYLEKEFNLSLEKLIEYTLPYNNAVRMIPKYKKNNKTSITYPKNYSVIIKKYGKRK